MEASSNPAAVGTVIPGLRVPPVVPPNKLGGITRSPAASPPREDKISADGAGPLAGLFLCLLILLHKLRCPF